MEEKIITEELTYGTVERITDIGKGTRVCIDCADILTPTEGVLVGNTGRGYVLVLSENRSTNTYPPRSFRINAGGLHQYLFQAGQTRYLEELRGGDPLFVYNGAAQKEIPIGRVKMEKRDLMRIEINMDGKNISATLQNADSVAFLQNNGNVLTAKELKEGDIVCCYSDEPGRHLGEKIEEEISEY
ncbi:3-dehydroquinate synthase [Salibacterium salarium]|uniref:3-dehydroquinate synthase n=1 Tax=Salibacterium salarium TaxID=284579 RepID=A0A428MZT0_9BACI|nr:3-dehydroquinate synthase II [Salibacterium salarium]RSL31683.1 3-dehydroquinate synthase [Salibacterium salarium]